MTFGVAAVAVLTALAAGVAGLFLSSRFLVPSGGAVVLAMSAIFFLTLAIGRLTRRRGTRAA